METKSNISTWDRLMMAITFAEAGEHETARDLITRRETKSRPTLGRSNPRPEIHS